MPHELGVFVRSKEELDRAQAAEKVSRIRARIIDWSWTRLRIWAAPVSSQRSLDGAGASSRLPCRYCSCCLARPTALCAVAPGSRRLRGRRCRPRPRRALAVHIGLGAKQSGEQARNTEIDIEALPVQPESEP